MWPRTMCSLSSFTRNIVLGRASTISPSISIFSSFPMRPGRVPKGSAPQLLRHGRQLGRIAGGGHPRQLQGVVLVARDHVQVEVEDRLPGHAPDVVEDV